MAALGRGSQPQPVHVCLSNTRAWLSVSASWLPAAADTQISWRTLHYVLWQLWQLVVTRFVNTFIGWMSLNTLFRFQDSTHPEQLCLARWTMSLLTAAGVDTTHSARSASALHHRRLTGHLRVGCSGHFMRNFCESWPSRTLFGHLVTPYSVLISVVPAYYLWLNKFHYSRIFLIRANTELVILCMLHVIYCILCILHIAYCILHTCGRSWK